MTLLTRCVSSSRVEKAVMAMGVAWSDSSRLWAVTMISSMVPDELSCAAACALVSTARAGTPDSTRTPDARADAARSTGFPVRKLEILMPISLMLLLNAHDRPTLSPWPGVGASLTDHVRH